MLNTDIENRNEQEWLGSWKNESKIENFWYEKIVIAVYFNEFQNNFINLSNLTLKILITNLIIFFSKRSLVSKIFVLQFRI